MAKILISPFSINKAWRGRRYKTKEYSDWRKEFSYLMLPRRSKMLYNESLTLDVVFGLKYPKKCDLDNLIKPFLDACVENGLIKDDRQITEIIAKKWATNKLLKENVEYINFN